MKHSSLESSHQEESNGGCFMFLGTMDGEIFNEMCSFLIKNLDLMIFKMNHEKNEIYLSFDFYFKLMYNILISDKVYNF
jgi:hypothetical protein